MSHSVEKGLKEAWDNFLKVLGGGVVAVGIYLIFISFGPGIEGRFFPVIGNYQLDNIRSLQDGGFSFRPTFTKERDCTYFGVTWFAQDADGNLTRIQLGRQSNQGPPVTGPTGKRLGERQTLFPPQGTVSIFGLNHHECGTPWQTRTMVGPFPIIDGKLMPAPTEGGPEG